MAAITPYLLYRKAACVAGLFWFDVNTKHTENEIDLDLLYSIDDEDVSWFWGVVLTMTPCAFLYWSFACGVIPQPDWLVSTMDAGDEYRDDECFIGLTGTRNSNEFQRICELGTHWSRLE